MPFDPKAVDGRVETARFKDISYERFRAMARDPSLSANEKIGMHDAVRASFDEAILADVVRKLPALDRPKQVIIDIGAGCGSFAHLFRDRCRRMEHVLVQVDSEEMLAHLPDAPFVRKVAGRFPENAAAVRAAAAGGADAVLAYGVLAAVFLDANPFLFVDQGAELLRPGGRMLLGDIANVSKLRRFLSSAAGRAYHAAYMRSDQAPEVRAFEPADDRIDDGVVLGILTRMRQSGFDAYVVPQSDALPMANRREDLLIMRP